MYAGNESVSDHLRILGAIRAYEECLETKSQTPKEFCEDHFLRFKQMDEIHKLRLQLVAIVKKSFSSISLPNTTTSSSSSSSSSSLSSLSSLDGKLPLTPLTDTDSIQLRQVLLSAFPDQVARVAPIEKDYGKKKILVYEPIKANALPLIWDTESCLNGISPPPMYVIYESLTAKSGFTTLTGEIGIEGSSTSTTTSMNDKLYMKNVTIVSDAWFPSFTPQLFCRSGTLLTSPEPKYISEQDIIIGYKEFTYGNRNWNLGVREIQLNPEASIKWFAKALLNGQVFGNTMKMKGMKMNHSNTKSKDKLGKVHNEDIFSILKVKFKVIFVSLFILFYLLS